MMSHSRAHLIIGERVSPKPPELKEHESLPEVAVGSLKQPFQRIRVDLDTLRERAALCSLRY
jgi:hypothetical protein